MSVATVNIAVALRMRLLFTRSRGRRDDSDTFVFPKKEVPTILQDFIDIFRTRRGSVSQTEPDAVGW